MMNHALFNLPPLAKNDLAQLPLGAVKPRGWLKKQLEVAAQGLTGKLYEFWPDVRDSAWRGRGGDGWERGPYYLDGLVPLSWLLDDDRLKAVCMEFIEWTLASQREDGSFGPESNNDWWPRMIMLKALIQYYSATVDKRVPEFMYNYFLYEYKTIDERPLKEWAAARGADNMLSIIWLYNLTGGRHEFLLKLLEKLRVQTLDWTGHFSEFPFTRSMKDIISLEELDAGLKKERGAGDFLTGTTRPYYGTQYHLSHVANEAMGLKAPGVISQFKNGPREQSGFAVGFEQLMKYHGVAYGMFTGDEHLSGNSPTQGTETCAVVELMFTVETLLATGIPTDGLGDLLEKLAFNALPGPMSPDMLFHQYDQQANQVRSCVGNHPWYNNRSDSNIFGLEPNYGCCTANLHQGWPKYAASLWYATSDGGLAAISYAPCSVRFSVGGAPVHLDVDTSYPFNDTVRIVVRTAGDAAFPIRLRIPAWAKEARLCVNDEAQESPKAGAWAEICRVWREGDVIELTMPMTPRLTRYARQSGAVEMGPLLMTFHPKEKWNQINDHPVVPDYEVSTEDDCSWALVQDGTMKGETCEREEPFGFGKGPRVIVDAVRAPEWRTDGIDCAPTPEGLECAPGDVASLTLEPYGDTCLRISQFPVAHLKGK